MTAPQGEGEAASPERTPWAHALALHTEGKTPHHIAEALAETGLDAESVRVVLNALPNARMPQALPEANLDLSVNALAPNHFSLLDLGLQGEPRTIGLYWLAFGLVLGVAMGALLLAGALAGHAAAADEAEENWQFATTVAIPRLGLGLSAAALGRGLFLWLTSVTIRRK